jgi:hypothetical protein
MIDPCWICNGKLEDETDGDGGVHFFCPVCRPRLAALEEVAGEVARLGRLVHRASKARPRRGGTPHDWPHAKLLYEQGMAQVAISRMLGIPINTLYNHRSLEKWMRPYSTTRQNHQKRTGVVPARGGKE